MRTTADSTRSAVGAARLAAAGLAMIAVCYGLARFAYGLFVPAFTAEFGLDAATAGAIASSSYVAYCVAIVVATLGTARWGPRRVVIAAGLAAAAGTGLIAGAPNVAVLAVGVVIGGSSTGLASPPLAEAVTRWVDAKRADRVQTVVNAGTGLGVSVSGPVALLLSNSWRLAWVVFCVLAVLVTIWTAVAVPGGARQDGAPATAPRSSPDAPARRAGRWRPGLARLLLAAATMGIGSSAVWVFGRDVVITVGQVSPLASTVMWIVMGVAGIAAAFTGDLVAKIGLGWAWVAGMLLLGTATATIALAPGSVPAIFSGAAVFGAVYIALTSVLLVWGTRAYPDMPAFGVGAPFLVLALGQATAAPVVGLLSDATSPAVAFGAAALAAVLGALARPRAHPPRPSDDVSG
jgi:predicted MFS family arabinose efflux permease